MRPAGCSWLVEPARFHSRTSSPRSPPTPRPSSGSSGFRPGRGRSATRRSCISGSTDPVQQKEFQLVAVIKTEKLTKSYGSHRGIVDVDLEVQQGEVFGFLGPNGAGKTTTIRVLLDLITPTGGKAFVFGIESPAEPVAIHRRIGYLPGEFTLYDKL